MNISKIISLYIKKERYERTYIPLKNNNIQMKIIKNLCSICLFSFSSHLYLF